MRYSWIIVASWIVTIVSTVVAFAIWPISRVINVDTEITEELGPVAKLKSGPPAPWGRA